MTEMQYLKNLSVPEGPIDVVLDTDTYNEIDDQLALAYLLKSPEKLTVRGVCAAPFLNERSVSPADGMEKSYREILTLLKLAGREDIVPCVYEGCRQYLNSETEPAESPATNFLATLANEYSPEKPLYIVAIGAITNVASALLKNPAMKENCVVVWLGGHSIHTPKGAQEFNMRQDIAAARVVFGCGVPLVHLPAFGVVDHLTTTRYELEHWLMGKNPLCDYLAQAVIDEAESYAAGKPWSRVIWDIAAIAWLLNDNIHAMQDRLMPAPIPEYDEHYAVDPTRHLIRTVYHIERDAVYEDLFRKLTQ